MELVSKQEVLDIVNSWHDGYAYIETTKESVKELEDLPTYDIDVSDIEPQKKVETVKVVIEISKVFYEYCKEQEDAIEVQLAIKNGILLPKGHGEIVDIRPLMRGLYEEMCTGGETYTTSDVYKMLEEECPVIIEADK